MFRGVSNLCLRVINAGRDVGSVVGAAGGVWFMGALVGAVGGGEQVDVGLARCSQYIFAGNIISRTIDFGILA